MVDRGDVDAEGVGRGIEIQATIGRATVVAHLEGEGGVARTDGVGRRREGEGRKADGGDLLASGDGGAAEHQGARRWQGGEHHALQRVGS